MDADLIEYLAKISQDLKASLEAYDNAETADECDVHMTRLRGAIEELENLIQTLKD